jgi:POT family proton-dependent oligopeptide transporter
VRVTALRKMTAGMFVMVLSFASAALVQLALDAGGAPHVAWQVPQFAFAAIGEVLVSVTALEFAYSQAPARWKSLIMGLWYATISAGSFLAAAVAWLNRFQGAAYYGFYAALMLAAAVIFAGVAWWYPVAPAAIAREAT